MPLLSRNRLATRRLHNAGAVWCRLVAWGLIATLILACHSAFATTVDLAPEADTWLDEQNVSRDLNYGSASQLLFSSKNRALLRFTLPSLPASAYVRSALLQLCVTNSGPANTRTSIYGIANGNFGWLAGTGNGRLATAGETTYSHRAYPATNWAGSAGLNSPGTDHLAAEAAFFSGRLLAPTCYTFDLTTLTRDWLGGVLPNAGIVIKTDSAADTGIASVDHPTLTLRPRLRIDYTVPIGFWRFEEASWNGTPDEVRNQLSDLHGVAAGGANTAATTPAIAGDPGTCRYANFDGVNDYVAITDDPRLDLTNEFTVMAWIRPTALYSSGGNSNLRSIFSRDSNFEFHINGSGQLYWWWQTIAGTTVTTRYINSTSTFSTNQWQHITLRYRAGEQRMFINGAAVNVRCSGSGTTTASCNYTGTLRVNNEDIQIGWDFLNGRQWQGQIDEVRIFDVALSDSEIATLYNQTFPCTASVHHYELQHDGQALTCQGENIVVRACADAACNTSYTANASVTLTPTGWAGGDSKTISGGILNATLWHTTPETIDIGISAASPIASNPLQCRNTFTGVASCAITFSDTGLLYDVPDVTANKTSAAFIIRAVKTDDITRKCTPYFPASSRTIKLWANYAAPTTGTLTAYVNNIAVTTVASGVTPATPTSQALTFNSNAEATLTVRYPDAGQLVLNARYDGIVGSDDAGLVLTGRGDTTFVSSPAGFCVQARTPIAAPTTALPNCANSSCPAYQRAGVDFPLRIQAMAWQVDGETDSQFCTGNALTPNFAGTVTLTHDMPDSFIEGSFSQPSVTLAGGTLDTNANFSEVGRFVLSTGGSYFGVALPVSRGDHIGRITPDHYNLTLNAFTAHCADADDFSYTGLTPDKNGELFALGTQVRAVNAGNAVTLNYVGGYARLQGQALTFSDFDGVNPAVDGQFVATAHSLNFGTGGTAGIATNDPSLDATTSPINGHYQFLLARAPYSVGLRADAIDSDGIIGSSAVQGPVQFRLGRLVLENAYGPEQLPLPIPLRAEYFDGSRWRANVADFCSRYRASDGSLSNHSGTLASGDTTLGTPVASTELISGRADPSAPLQLSAPGLGENGSVTVTLTVPSWLQFDWNGDNSHIDNPTATATFGRYRGSDRVIYWRERLPAQP